MKEAKGLYERLGIDPHKGNVKKIWKRVVQSIHPGSFVVIKYDPNHPDWVVSKHSDGSGSKSVQRYLHTLELRDSIDVIKTLGEDFDDALGMNIGDSAAAGFVSNIEITDHVAIDPLLKGVTKEELMLALANRYLELQDLYASHGIKLIHFGGETADLPDQLRSWTLDVDIRASIRAGQEIRGNVRHEDSIFGFRSDGRAAWEDRDNGGLMSNWYTLARKGMMDSVYNLKYPFLCHPERGFFGRYMVTTEEGRQVSEQILTPTRQWGIVIKILLDELDNRNARDQLHGITQNTGGGASKVLNVGNGIVYRKTMPAPQELVKLIQSETGEEWGKVYTGSNCGIGLDVIGANHNGLLQDAIEATSKRTNVAHQMLGSCEVSRDGYNHVYLDTPYGQFDFHEDAE